MNWMEFISSLFKNLVWPVVILIAASKLKEPLSNLISTIAKIKYKEWEVEFQLEKRLDKITALASEKSDEKDQPETMDTTREDETARDFRTGFLFAKAGSGKTSSVLSILMEKQDKGLNQLISKIYYSVTNDKDVNSKAIVYMITRLIDEGIFSEELAESIYLVKQMRHDIHRMNTPLSHFLEEKYINSINLVFERLNSILNNLNQQSSE
ncbi:hypothetical protein P8841_11195 [Bacillus spizizenii]|nr:hypothetical protein [Bacillus spizizenii]MEC0566334.1 hypothetical protein [Bacillus spizizenii]